jgi:hypothetical protein
LTKPPTYAIIHSESEVTIMNCLKCSNYWKTDIDETQCDKCGCSAETSEAKEEGDKKDGEKASDLC